MSSNNYEPRIVAFLCRWCAYAGADTAGVMRLEYPPNIVPIRVPCSGRVDPVFIIHALVSGADGVLVGACHPGDCHYIEGNMKAKKRISFLKSILEPLGLSNRVRMEYVSATEGARFREVVSDFVSELKKMGANPLKTLNTFELIKKIEKYLNHEDKYTKRKAFCDVLRELIRLLGGEIDPNKEYKIDEDIIPEGFGFPSFDTEKCLGCGACANICPQNVIKVIDANGKRIIARFSCYCMVCKECADACPQNAIMIESGFDLKAFLVNEPTPGIEHMLRKCKICGRYFIPTKEIEHVSDKFPFDFLDICPECRMKHNAELVINYATPVI